MKPGPSSLSAAIPFRLWGLHRQSQSNAPKSGTHSGSAQSRGDAPVAGKVALISGEGSGHEPMHGGFVGMGMPDGDGRAG
ncbi:MAG: dihydroxyacetone kinase subunit DhaK [Caldilineaceae bacterium]|nr:dihydroxyacetone kinase subunit DhaK [Caldilineaceae bacterium]